MKTTSHKRFVARPDHRNLWLRRWVVVDSATSRIVPPAETGPDTYLTEREARHKVAYLEQTQEAAA